MNLQLEVVILDASMAEVAEGDLLPGLDVLLREEDLDFHVVLKPMSRIGNAGMVHSGQSAMKKKPVKFF